MDYCSEWIKAIVPTLPDSCRAQNLVKAGIYKNVNAVHYARRNGLGPPFIRITKKDIIYPKLGVIQWLQERQK